MDRTKVTLHMSIGNEIHHMYPKNRALSFSDFLKGPGSIYLTLRREHRIRREESSRLHQ
jgi:hypothetical protein